MNQTKKRLSIINLAISITDIETIQLQILKLGLLMSDIKIQEIITMLQAENYAKAQRLIKVYIDTPMEEILQRSSQRKSLDIDIEAFTTPNKKKTIISKEDQKVIDEFQLFTTHDNNNAAHIKKKEIDINDYLTDTSLTPNTQINPQINPQEANFDALLNIEARDVMPNINELDISQEQNDSFNESFFDISEKKEKLTLQTDEVQRDTFFDLNETEETAVEETPSNDLFETLLTVETNTKKSLNKDALTKKAEIEKTFREKSSFKKPFGKEPVVKEKVKQKPIDITSDIPLKEALPKKKKIEVKPGNYPSISYIRQKFVSMRKQYEPIQKGHERFPTVETFLTTISQDGYKEKEIEETFTYIEKLITEEKFAEAGQLLLVCASTESKFAQLMLARELYRGILLRKNVSEAFYILTHMADENYPEALCDLGQFHENGIGTGRDKKIAKELYKQAMDLGITRAEKHYTRLKKTKKGFFKK